MENFNSPTESNAGGQQELLLPALTRRATIGDPVYDNTVSKQKRRAVAVACERCRRRKIRCDGFQPCATCARFSVRCVRAEERRERSSSTAETAALAQRVRQLEARLAANDQGLSPSSGTFDGSGSPSRPPALHLQTSFDDMSSSFHYDDSSQMETSMDSAMSLSVPAIQVTGPQGGTPSSPFLSPNSPTPSLFSGTSGASSPDPFAATAWNMEPGSQAFNRTPPVTDWADFYESSALLATPGVNHSRRSSISSFGGLGPSFCSMNLDGSTSPQDWTDQGPAELPPWNFNQEQSSFPSIPLRHHAEALAEHVFTHRRIPLERTAFKVCLEAVYERDDTPNGITISQTMLSSFTRYSLRMAKCLVFLVLTIGAKLHAAAGEDGSVASVCYAVVHEEIRGLDFWSEAGSQEVLGLLGMLSEICTM